MKVFIKFDFNTVCQRILEEKLDACDIKYRILGIGEVDFLERVSVEKMKLLTQSLGHYGIEIVENQKAVLVQKIKVALVEMIRSEDTSVNVKSSVYLAEKLHYSYGYLTNLFSEVTYSSIENFIILQKIEYAKQLIITDQFSFTEIAFKLNYSSVAHLSSQFKNVTGLPPSSFQRIIKRRRELSEKQ